MTPLPTVVLSLAALRDDAQGGEWCGSCWARRAGLAGAALLFCAAAGVFVHRRRSAACISASGHAAVDDATMDCDATVSRVECGYVAEHRHGDLRVSSQGGKLLLNEVDV